MTFREPTLAEENNIEAGKEMRQDIRQFEAELAGANRELDRLRSIIAGTDKPLIVQNEDGGRWLSLDDIKTPTPTEEKYRDALLSIVRRRPIMGSSGDYRVGQEHALEAVRETATEALKEKS